QPEIRAKLISIAFEPWHGTPAELQRTVASEYARWGDVVEASGMTAQ
ncbi:MAG: tripartite tricarboxylate transporter substrate binding protein, partial [Ramlibacter sp.]|nr:tripartite tricarboxylate transporter substrate binding protein [Ramlibacter sp.]